MRPVEFEIEESLDGIDRMRNDISGSLDLVFDPVVDIAKDLTDLIPGIRNRIDDVVFDAIPDGLRFLADPIPGIGSGCLDAFNRSGKETGNSILDAFKEGFDAIPGFFPGSSKPTADDIKNILHRIEDVIEPVLDAVPDSLEDLFHALPEQIPVSGK